MLSNTYERESMEALFYAGEALLILALVLRWLTGGLHWSYACNVAGLAALAAHTMVDDWPPYWTCGVAVALGGVLACWMLESQQRRREAEEALRVAMAGLATPEDDR